MVSLTLTIGSQVKNPKKILVEMDFEKFERLAANLGFFNQDFLKSVDLAEKDYKNGRIKKIRSLGELRR
ncbi:MAG: hypothetical protein COX37_01640 [Candidatus Nealsonbacteria bacterium CG23_combo_of_CG06-09_8_20_14_all_39_17]|uniref:Uncharacterized protein n=1 Tax=Candidatus Nealsonbacteria bacterium CG23_combo_of_CG06-09_8_20_14_all_39_17 TaxID=1974722 RepID=A0A2G9YUG7_9BACT|nr:MAG: hypothetical protein COX37_01640 [Candidatus Nealsonbacteria bacterium CG23_combo_of_CG06-09_8_20_14_all_39_17]PIU43655.1 MAG: hypothetical protein COS96_03220 [Candidatus Nealsonbacteria bacterium CG07_land_8_20_14_0_80_39_13]